LGLGTVLTLLGHRGLLIGTVWIGIGILLFGVLGIIVWRLGAAIRANND
jgi:hypothetical protein